MQPLGLTAARLEAYKERLFGSHDYRIDVDILTLDERPAGTARFLDGQVNIGTGDAVRRTASLTVSDTAGALDFAGATAWSGSTVWVDRLVRIQHVLEVPGVGEVRVTPFIGPPSKITRSGATVSIECQDKAALAMRGAPPLTVKKGENAVRAIREILAMRTGEFRFRLGSSQRRLSDNYSVGWSDEASPWAVATRIAERELGLQLIMSCDGYATLRRRPTRPQFTVPYVTSEPENGVDFTQLANWIRVAGKKKSKTKDNVVTTTQPVAVAVVAAGQLSPSGIARKGVKRYLPLLLEDDRYTKVEQVKDRAREELEDASRLQAEPSFSCVPFFHADVDDIVKFTVPGADVEVRMTAASIPLGTSGEMTVGSIRWVSRSPRQRVKGYMTKHVRKKKPKKKPDKGKGKKGGK